MQKAYEHGRQIYHGDYKGPRTLITAAEALKLKVCLTELRHGMGISDPRYFAAPYCCKGKDQDLQRKAPSCVYEGTADEQLAHSYIMENDQYQIYRAINRFKVQPKAAGAICYMDIYYGDEM